jgi:hypothetical protein
MNESDVCNQKPGKSMSTNIDEISGYFGDLGCQLYGTFYSATAKPKASVLIASPYGEERKCATRLLVDLARELAVNELDVLRFDYAGTGESTGDLAKMSLGDWRGNVSAAFLRLRKLSTGRPLMGVGARLGGNLLLGGPFERVKRLVLLEPLAGGNAFVEEMVRRKQIKEMMGGGAAASESDSHEAQWQRGEAVDFDGFPMSAEFGGSLAALSLATDLECNAELAIMIANITGAKRLANDWQTVYSWCEDTAAHEFQTIHEKPFWGRLDYARSDTVIDKTVAFLLNEVT